MPAIVFFKGFLLSRGYFSCNVTIFNKITEEIYKVLRFRLPQTFLVGKNLDEAERNRLSYGIHNYYSEIFGLFKLINH